jgi:hypothetical protein
MQTCAPNGQWITESECPMGGCTPKGCPGCTPNQKACDESEVFLYTCGSDGGWISPPAECLGGCLGGQCFNLDSGI